VLSVERALGVPGVLVACGAPLATARISKFQRSNAVEDGVRVHIDTVQVVEEPYSPMTVPPTGMALFTPRRTTREWTGYGMGNVRRGRVDGDSDAFNPSTIISTSSIPEVTAEVDSPDC
jgi:hypothetical protein